MTSSSGNPGRAAVVTAVPATFILMTTILLVEGVAEAGTREALRATARLSLVLFLMAFVARPLQQLYPSRLGRWLMKNRSLIGVCFGLSLSAHILLIVWLFVLSAPHIPRSVGFLDILVGGAGLLVVLAMIVTSTAGIRRAMGARAWQRLHLYGQYLVWFVFTFCLISSYAAKSPPYPWWHYVPLFVLLLGAAVLRLAAALSQPAYERAHRHGI